MKNQKKSYVPIELLLVDVQSAEVCTTSYETSTEKMDEMTDVIW